MLLLLLLSLLRLLPRPAIVLEGFLADAVLKLLSPDPARFLASNFASHIGQVLMNSYPPSNFFLYNLCCGWYLHRPRLSQFLGVDDTTGCDGDVSKFLATCDEVDRLLAIVIFGFVGGVLVSPFWFCWTSHLSSNWLTLTGRGTKDSLLLVTVVEDELNLLLLALTEDSLRFLFSSPFFFFAANGNVGGGGGDERAESFILVLLNVSEVGA
mmetsp:Transcript_26165/g.41097  ORF Transcript_26165/g.41097 Transcript_26165/m.41097 type:complete len:211 (-) Transcript_26165:320-952(-)